MSNFKSQEKKKIQTKHLSHILYFFFSFFSSTHKHIFISAETASTTGSADVLICDLFVLMKSCL